MSISLSSGARGLQSSVVKKIDTNQYLSISSLLSIIDKEFEIIDLDRFLWFFLIIIFWIFFHQLPTRLQVRASSSCFSFFNFSQWSHFFA